ncbi:MAG TPA: molybdopterin cofactor-binding domain-containing protein [Pyrinomonadaceae bacterium]|nr:molybdopterin cofactor-binding domain-containing protein [Pyrinomonadaceae bacterium]
MRVTRRAFLKDSAYATAGLTIAFHLTETQAVAAESPATFAPNAFIRISSDNTITLTVTRSEMGQGVRTNLPAVLAEELEVDLNRIQLEQAIPGPKFKGIRLRTSGSGSSAGNFMPLRRAGAAAREMLIAAAAQKWSVDPGTCEAQDGVVQHQSSSRTFTYGELAVTAATIPVPQEPKLKDPKNFKLIGKPLKRTDAPAIVTGAAVYGLDMRVPGMLFAALKRCPYLGGKVLSFDAKKALAITGVRHVVPITKGISTGVAVVADNTWTAFKGVEALEVKWDVGPNHDFDSDRFLEKLQTNFSQEGYPIRREGDVNTTPANATKRLDAVYVYPFQAHAALETLNCIADVRKDSCEIWVPTQTPDTAHQDIQKQLGFPADRVSIHTTLLGGAFGRRLFNDFIQEAVELSQAVAKPVQLVWTRNDDMRNGYFHPASAEQMSARLDTQGNIAWLHKSAGSDLSMYPAPTAEEKKNVNRYAEDETPWGAFDNPYSFASMKVDYVPVDSPVPTGPWRAVMYPARVFAREAFLDEIAHALGKDPLQWRIDLLKPGTVLTLGSQKIDRGRMIRVLEAIREKSGWNKPLVRSGDSLWGRGLAVNVYSADSYLAQVAEVSVTRDLKDIRVRRIVCVFDCGMPINPLGLEGQVESGITWGLSAALHGKIDFRNGGALQGTFSDFQVMRMKDMPVIETHILPSTAPPSGFGEHPVPPVAPAVSNAIFAATGKRLRKLPFATADLLAS